MKILSFKRLQLAISFYTRLPIMVRDSTPILNYSELPQAVIYLHLIGWIVGACSGLAFYLAVCMWSQVTAVVIALTAAIILTGALHEDGFPDVCDGFGGGWDKTHILAIMKDSRIGVYGVLGLIFLVSIKISVLSNLPTVAVPWVLLVAHSVSRFMPLLLMYNYNYSRTEASKVAGAVYAPDIRELLFSAGLASLPLLLLPVLSCLAIMPILLVNYWLGRYFYRHIGGYTGDCLGTSQQTAEVIFYLSVSSLWTFI